MPILYLIPNFISQDNQSSAMVSHMAGSIKGIRIFFVEEPKSARSLLKKIDPQFPLTDCQYIELSEHSLLEDIQKNFKEANGKDIAVVSEAGYPCVADPGTQLVLLAQQAGYEIVPLLGASSIILALAASGLNGQNFAFNGYLPKDKGERLTKIRNLEQRSKKEGQTQIFMEAPYRNGNLMEDLLAACQPQTLLCIACDITGLDQKIQTLPVGQWKQREFKFPKKPCLFLLLYN